MLSDVQPKISYFFRSNWFILVVELVIAGVWLAFIYELVPPDPAFVFANLTFALSGPFAVTATILSIRNLVLRKRRLWVAIASVVFGLLLCAFVFITGFEVMALSVI
jgi:hypothetical protein